MYFRQEPWGEDWYYDKFGRYPSLGDVIVYSEYDGDRYSMCLGLVIYSAPSIMSFGKPIFSFYVAPLRNPSEKKEGERFIKFYEKTGLAAYSPLIDLAYLRSNDNIVLLDSYIFTLVSPHIL